MDEPVTFGMTMNSEPGSLDPHRSSSSLNPACFNIF
jgi:hypothetical protein